MAHDWEKLTQLVGDQAFVIERVRMADTGIAIEGPFELPPLARLGADDQVFLAAFARSHGSIKRMEEWFGVSYPTIKNRLNRIAAQLEFVETRTSTLPEPLERLAAGEISVDEASHALSNRRKETTR
ncbi:MAG: DUF2089 domain-containing protein [Alphaproteobacteria bacterium]|nr:DUF2089 domain-containing protein [Alphaproteobacteria bacterium]